MAPPNPLDCSVPDCTFTTPQGCPTWDLMVTLLTQHNLSVHATGQPPQPNHGNKLEKLPRPTFNLQMSEAQWSFTKRQWHNYINQTNVPDAVKLTQLQAACSEPLRQRVFDTGLYSTLSTPDLFLAEMEELAVVKVHKSVHLRNL